VRTSRANRLGIYGIAQWFTGYPHIVAPVYKKGADGKLAPFRLTWPAFWAIVEEETITPLQPGIIQELGQGILDCEEQAAKLLLTLAANPELKGEPVLAVQGKFYRRNIDGLLNVSIFSGGTAEEMLWLKKTAKDIIPLIPDFDTTAEQLDVDVENLITNTLEALSTLQWRQEKPALVYKEKFYHIVDGYLVSEINPGEPAPKPRLCRLENGKILPLISPFILRSVLATVGNEETLTEEQVKLMLVKFAETLKNLPSPAHPTSVGERLRSKASADAKFVYISGGRLFELDGGGNLIPSKHEAAEPVTWPLAHDVRPARRALGANGCKDCHSASSTFFFAKVKAAGPLKTETQVVRSMHRFMGKDKYYETLFGLSFTFRPVLKIVLFIAAVLTASILLLIFLLALAKFSGLISAGTASRPTQKPKREKSK
jgi:hypothetical protein